MFSFNTPTPFEILNTALEALTPHVTTRGGVKLNTQVLRLNVGVLSLTPSSGYQALVDTRR